MSNGTVIAVGNEHDEPSLNPERGSFTFHSRCMPFGKSFSTHASYGSIVVLRQRILEKKNSEFKTLASFLC